MEGRQKRKANVLPAADYEAAVGSAYMDSGTGPRRENGKIVPRHLLVFHTPEEKIIHLTAEYTVRIGDIYKQIEECVGYPVFLQQTDKKNNTVILDQDEIAEDGMNFGYSVQVVRRRPKLESYFQTKAVRSWACRLHEIAGVLRAAAPKEAKEPDPPADDKHKEAKEPDPPPDKGGRSYHIKKRLPPAGVPRGVPGDQGME
jgi:hypothetical protein